jgi:hypothetical protein
LPSLLLPACLLGELLDVGATGLGLLLEVALHELGKFLGALLLALGRFGGLAVDQPVRVGEGLGETPGRLVYVLHLSLVNHVLFSFRAGVHFNVSRLSTPFGREIHATVRLCTLPVKTGLNR